MHACPYRENIAFLIISYWEHWVTTWMASPSLLYIISPTNNSYLVLQKGKQDMSIFSIRLKVALKYFSCFDTMPRQHFSRERNWSKWMSHYILWHPQRELTREFCNAVITKISCYKSKSNNIFCHSNVKGQSTNSVTWFNQISRKYIISWNEF